jgi:thermitase
VKIASDTGTIACSAAANGIIWAADQGAKVINMSFGGTSPCDAEASALAYAWNKGTVLVASAGNSSSSTPTFPAAYPNVLSVSATQSDDSIASYSNFGSWISVAAPGSNIVTTYNNGGYAGFSGTSAAAPVVAGVAALVIAANRSLSNTQVESIIEQNADDLGTPGFDDLYGWGRVNSYRAVSAAIGSAPPPPDTIPPTASITSPSAGATVSGLVAISVAATDNVGVAQVQLAVDGSLVATDTSSPFSFGWDSTTVPDGNHTLQAIALDGAGNAGSSAPVSLAVQNSVKTNPPPSPPTVAVTAPVAGAVVSGIVKVTIVATSSIQIQSVQSFVDGKSLGTLSCASSSCTGNFRWNTKQATKGAHSLTANAIDAAASVGNSAAVIVYK